MRVYLILTQEDKNSDEKKLADVRSKYTEALRISEFRILKLSNYTSEDVMEDGRTKPNFEKDLQVLNAFNRILRKAENRDRMKEKAKKEEEEATSEK